MNNENITFNRLQELLKNPVSISTEEFIEIVEELLSKLGEKANLKKENHYLNESGEHLSALLLAEQDKSRNLVAEGSELKEQLLYIVNSDIDYHSEGVGCGLEDNEITDRYEAAEYGFNEAKEQFYSDIVSYINDIKTPTIDAAQQRKGE